MAFAVGLALLLSSCLACAGEEGARKAHALLKDGSAGANWPGFDRTYGEQHYSPLDQLDAKNVGRLGLAWSIDLEPGNPVSGPIAVDGILYTSTGYSIVRAIDVVTGKQLWLFDPRATEKAGRKMRQGWGSRGLAWWNGRIYVGTIDGRLIAIDAKTGREVWSVMTVGKDDYRFITGAPRVFDGKVIIGHGGADSAAPRGYVTTYDAETGRQLWRFYVVPGNPADGFEDEAQAMAAKTWAGEWWKQGGVGTVWNAMTYDTDTDTVFIGTGNGAPWNRRVRSADRGDNLFLCSIVALDAKSGKYKWHYQVNPGESWDFNASMDMQLADLVIDGKMPKVLMQAPKNGFFYVIDRLTGKLLSAGCHCPGDLGDGSRLEERAADRGARSALPEGHGLRDVAESPWCAYLVALGFQSEVRADVFAAAGHRFQVRRRRHRSEDLAAGVVQCGGTGANVTPASQGSGRLLAWDPVTRQAKWSVVGKGVWMGGVLATSGNLVFQGEADGILTAYDAGTGEALWHFDARSSVLAPPITYSAGGRQYVTVMSGMGTSPGTNGAHLNKPVNYRTQTRRILTFVLDAKVQLPPAEPVTMPYADDPDYKPEPAAAARGAVLFRSCFTCHPGVGYAGGTAPELAMSLVPSSAAAFETIVRKGALVANGMPRFEEFTDEELDALRQYVRSETRRIRNERRDDAAAR